MDVLLKVIDAAASLLGLGGSLGAFRRGPAVRVSGVKWKTRRGWWVIRVEVENVGAVPVGVKAFGVADGRERRRWRGLVPRPFFAVERLPCRKEVSERLEPGAFARFRVRCGATEPECPRERRRVFAELSGGAVALGLVRSAQEYLAAAREAAE